MFFFVEQRLEQLQKEMDEIEASGEPDEERIEEIKNEAEPLEEQCELFDSLQQHVQIRICKILSLLFASSPKVEAHFPPFSFLPLCSSS